MKSYGYIKDERVYPEIGEHGLCYKDPKVFKNNPDGVCYIGKDQFEDDFGCNSKGGKRLNCFTNLWTHNSSFDFICNQNEKLTDEVFKALDGQTLTAGHYVQNVNELV